MSFPSNPNDQDTHTLGSRTFRYDGSKGRWTVYKAPSTGSVLADVIANAPESLNTFNELAAALGDDANFAATVTNSLAAKADTTYVDTEIAAIPSFDGTFQADEKLSLAPELYVAPTYTKGSTQLASGLGSPGSGTWTISNHGLSVGDILWIEQPVYSWYYKNEVIQVINANQFKIGPDLDDGVSYPNPTWPFNVYNAVIGGGVEIPLEMYYNTLNDEVRLDATRTVKISADIDLGTNSITAGNLFSGSYNDLTDQPDLTGYATETYVDTAVAGIVDTAPATLDTLNELAAALGDDANFATTVTDSIALKANTADLATVATSGDYNDLLNAPSGGGGTTFDFTANGDISAGNVVQVRTDGTVEAIVGSGALVSETIPVHAPALFTSISGTVIQQGSQLSPDGNHIIVCYEDRTAGNSLSVIDSYIIMGSWDAANSQWVWGTPYEVKDDTNTNFCGSMSPRWSNTVSDKALLVYSKYGDTIPRGKTLTVNTTTKTFSQVNDVSCTDYSFQLYQENVKLSSRDVLVWAAEAGSMDYWGQSVWNPSTGTFSNFYAAIKNGTAGNTFRVDQIPGYTQDDLGATYGDLFLVSYRSGNYVVAYVVRIKEGGVGSGLAMSSPPYGSEASAYMHSTISNDYKYDWAPIFDGQNKQYISMVVSNGSAGAIFIMLLQLNDPTNPTGFIGNNTGVVAYGVVTGAASQTITGLSDRETEGRILGVYQDKNSPYGMKYFDGTWDYTNISLTFTHTTTDLNALNGLNMYQSEMLYAGGGRWTWLSGSKYINTLQLAADTRSTNMIESTVIGVAQANASNGASVTVDLKGNPSSVFSGLTPGSLYYAQPDGTVTTTSAEGSPLMGLALASDTIMLQN